jgi:hypothetical protein
MRRYVIVISLVLILGNWGIAVEKIWAGGSGNGANRYKWDNPNNWSPAGEPRIIDNVTIPATTFQPGLYADGATCANLTINNGATLNINNFNLTISANATVNGNITYGTGRINITGMFMRNNLSGTGIKRLLSQNNYINIHTSGISSITLQAFPNTYPPNTPGTYDSTRSIKRYYTISSVTGTGDAFMRLDYLATEMGSLFTATNGNVWQYTESGPWLNRGQLIAGNYFAESVVPIPAVNLIGDYNIADENVALPVQLASFFGKYVCESVVELRWQTISEVNNYGFNVQRYNNTAKSYENIGFVEGIGTILEPQTYTFLDDNITGSVEYRLEQIDNDGLLNYYGPIILYPNSVGNDEAVPALLKLDQNYPNPFNPSTKISFSLANPGFTTLKIYNIIGLEVATLFNGNAESGKLYVVIFDASTLSSGLYLYRLESDKFVSVKKMTLLK